MRRIFPENTGELDAGRFGDEDSRPVWKAYLILAVGVIALATSAPIIKSTDLPEFSLAFGRLALGSLLLLPVMLLQLRRERRSMSIRDWMIAAPGGIFLGLHLCAWNLGVRDTTVANATLIVTLTPAFMPFAMYFAVRERVTIGEVVGSLISMSGVAVLTMGRADFGLHTVRGDVICFVAMLLVIVYLIAGRMRNHGRSIWLYLSPLYAWAALACLPGAIYEASKQPISIDFADARAVVLLTLVPTLIGHSAYNFSMLNLRSQVVSISNLFQFMVAGTIAYVVRDELPERNFYPAALLVTIGAVVVVRHATPRVARAIEEASEID